MARVSVPVVTISPAASGGLITSRASKPTRCSNAETGPPRIFSEGPWSMTRPLQRRSSTTGVGRCTVALRAQQPKADMKSPSQTGAQPNGPGRGYGRGGRPSAVSGQTALTASKKSAPIPRDRTPPTSTSYPYKGEHHRDNDFTSAEIPVHLTGATHCTPDNRNISRAVAFSHGRCSMRAVWNVYPSA